MGHQGRKECPALPEPLEEARGGSGCRIQDLGRETLAEGNVTEPSEDCRRVFLRRLGRKRIVFYCLGREQAGLSW